MPPSMQSVSLPAAPRFRRWFPRSVIRLARAGAAIILSAALITAAGCGFDVQTNRPYDPGEGLNVDVGNRQDGTVAVRNLLIASREAGTGFISASLTGTQDDTLQRITGRAYTADGTAGTPLTAAMSGPISIEAGSLVVLTDQELIMVTGADLAPGLEAELTLTFATAGETTLRVPVVTADDPQFATISPSPSGSPTAE